MNQNQKEARINRMNDAFNKCVGGTRESSIAVFGVNSFPELIGKKFYFLVHDHLLLQDGSKFDPQEAFLGQVTGVLFSFLVDGLETPAGKDWKQYCHEAETICDLNGHTCFPYIQTTVGLLSPPWQDDEVWFLDPNNNSYECEGTVIFL
jgi:hypothetical protein